MKSPVFELAARELEPPQPAMKTLEAVVTLPEDATLRVHARWRPALLPTINHLRRR